ncbi:hypothetical protein like AT1G32928 [Hibiscus trionum]|uniref:Uncharacterized protein n=1 Tax=Hibiscus trionum TaxID=183268 RepID=A0A9W7IIE5_HIBTR|nr:hypothetical protein like AT1G32928 [Hibiscus trionum]
MNSIFTSFDALCAEFLGQTIRPSFASSTPKHGKVAIATNKASEDMNKNQQGNVEKSQQRAPRFAPELDGLHCFETLVSY